MNIAHRLNSRMSIQLYMSSIRLHDIIKSLVQDIMHYFNLANIK